MRQRKGEGRGAALPSPQIKSWLGRRTLSWKFSPYELVSSVLRRRVGFIFGLPLFCAFPFHFFSGCTRASLKLRRLQFKRQRLQVCERKAIQCHGRQQTPGRFMASCAQSVRARVYSRVGIAILPSSFFPVASFLNFIVLAASSTTMRLALLLFFFPVTALQRQSIALLSEPIVSQNVSLTLSLSL